MWWDWGIVSSSEESGIWNQPLQTVELLSALDSPLGSFLLVIVGDGSNNSSGQKTWEIAKPWGSPPSPGPDFPVTHLQEISSAVQSWVLGSKPAWWGPSKLPQHLQFYMQEVLRFQHFVRVRSSPWLGSVCLAGAKGPPAMGFPLNLLQRQTVSLSIWSLKRPGLLPRSCSQIYVGKFP